MRKPRHGEIKQFAQGLPGGEWKPPNSSPESDLGDILSAAELIAPLSKSHRPKAPLQPSYFTNKAQRGTVICPKAPSLVGKTVQVALHACS